MTGIRSSVLTFSMITSIAFLAVPRLNAAPPTKVTWPRLADSELPTTPPFLGAGGIDRYGYPNAGPDKVRLLETLRAKRFDDLDRFFTYYQDAFERDYHKELWPEQAVSAFYASDPALEPILDEWVAASPASFAAHVARGNYRYGQGWLFRGHEYATSTSEAQFRSMEMAFRAAQKDLGRAIALRPGLVAARTRLLLIAGVSGAGSSARRAILKSAVARCPLCFATRAAEMEQLTPRWGGSYEQMAGLVRATAAASAKNPRLKLLSGFADWDRCDSALLEAGRPGAAAACAAAVSVGDEPRFLVAKARLLIENKDYQGAIGLLDRALQVEPQQRDALLHRSRARILIGDAEGGTADLILAGQLDPADPYLNQQALWWVQRLGYDGGVAAKAGKHADAVRLFALALRLAPGNTDLLHWIDSSRRAMKK